MKVLKTEEDTWQLDASINMGKACRDYMKKQSITVEAFVESLDITRSKYFGWVLTPEKRGSRDLKVWQLMKVIKDLNPEEDRPFELHNNMRPFDYVKILTGQDLTEYEKALEKEIYNLHQEYSDLFIKLKQVNPEAAEQFINSSNSSRSLKLQFITMDLSQR